LSELLDNLDVNVKFKINHIGFDAYPKWINIQVPKKNDNTLKSFEEILENSSWKYLRIIK
jgi:hypothetical protein